ncbi:hypothetical protein KDA23_01805 [Candidatus Saccharibacteria bacterium]|nr:hypothetical protein [Candidatus Saccharibacteria bacterium]
MSSETTRSLPHNLDRYLVNFNPTKDRGDRWILQEHGGDVTKIAAQLMIDAYWDGIAHGQTPGATATDIEWAQQYLSGKVASVDK